MWVLPVWYRKYYRSLFSKISNSGYQNWKKQRMKRFYSKFIKPGDLCFDIGANTGVYSKVFLDMGARVIAVEPIHENMLILNQQFSAENNLMAIQAAVSAKMGMGEIHKGDFLELSTLDKDFVRFNEIQSNDRWSKKQSVQLITLDELIKNHGLPDFCKIDVEGHEKEVLSGLTTAIPVISFEFLFPFKDKSLECIRKISGLSPKVRYNYSLYEFFELENEEWLDTKSFINCLKNLPQSHWTGDIFCKLE
jgi:FkbM family methyltransferase